ncbi:hypothetical protein PMAYCL1PPCAC_06315 [Pristionchus mayeri]|uniref:Uncharacterized protein n=1 Tax=Pristionchus mayeri TaxID=1317129 RepID=A0AAN4ZFP9_9BILA|nr:hypothetical protein PMAYCL1PPCAC_06315 [Pristionchus mayeri]
MSMLEYEKDPGWQYLKRSREQQIADQSTPYDSKKNVWLPDAEEGYIAAEIKSSKGDMTTVVTAKGDSTVKKDLLQEMNPPKFEKTEDMSNLSFLNDASVLHNLRARYAAMLIYTYSGLFCVVINPYKRLPIYTDSVARMFMGKRRTEMPPHLFAVSDEAYRNMLIDHENQSMLITGESGAGKTENTKKVIAYFAAVGASQQGTKSEGEKTVTLEDQIVQTNPVLEAFGNAKTVRNNNSSRFGKFIRIHFSKQGRLASCDIEHYLLEKSRVIRQAPGERCYHIFYQIFCEAIPGIRAKLLLDKPLSDYWFVAQAELTIDGIDDVEECKLTDEAFDILNFSNTEKYDCYKLMAAHMHMGNMKFKQRPREEQAEPDGQEDAEKACKMFGIDVDAFLKALVSPRVKVGTEWVSKGQNVEQVNWAIGAMAKGLYARVFDWLVKMCNKTLDQQGISRDYFIGVLDIAGFEIFDFNSFEQLWINFVNEKLQQFFNHHMFVLEQEEYKREGIDWVFIDFGLDLQACIELIEKPLGIISMLDEECIVPKATDMTLAQKLVEQHLGKHPNFEKPKPPKGKQGEAHFAMRHYAGTVRYNVLNWLEKNKDPLNDTVVSVMKAGKENALLTLVWESYQTQEEAAIAAKSGGGKKKGKSGSFMTVSMMYRESLNNLMNMLHKTHPHFIRCIIPNEKKASGVIDASLVLNQLTCNGVLEGIRICRKGFPNRTLHPDFVFRYGILAAEAAKSVKDPKAAATAILNQLIKEKKLKDEQFRIGHTKVFFKAGIVAHIEDLRDEKMNAIITGFQAMIRSWHGKVLYKKHTFGLEVYGLLQKTIRWWNKNRDWDWWLLYARVKPMLKGPKKHEELLKAKEQYKVFAEKTRLLELLEGLRGGGSAIEDRLKKLNANKLGVEKQLNEAHDKLGELEERNSELDRQKKRSEHEVDQAKKVISNLESSLEKAESDKQAKENQIRALQDEMNNQDESIAKLNKEKKHQEEVNRQLVEDLQASEGKIAGNNRQKQKLEQTLDEVEEAVERERRSRGEIEKNKRKIESELKGMQENIDEMTSLKLASDANLKKKEAEMHALAVRMEDEKALQIRMGRQAKELAQRLVEIEDELENERQARAKRDAEIAKIRRDLEDKNIVHEDQLAAQRKKNNDQIADLTLQLEQLQKAKIKAEKDRGQVQKELDDINNQLDIEAKNRAEQERLAKMYEVQVEELQQKVDEQARQISEYSASKGRLNNENGDLVRTLEELEIQFNALSRSKAQLVTQVTEAKKAAEEESHERQEINAAVRNLEHEIESMQESLEEQIESKSEIMRQLSKVNSEISHWKSRYEGEGLVGAEEVEEAKRKQIARYLDLQDALNAANNKISSLEKAKSRLLQETEDARSDVDRHLTTIATLEKKQKAFDKIVEDWKKKTDDIQREVDAANRDARNTNTEVFRLRSGIDSLTDLIEQLRRENKNFSMEIRDVNEQIFQGGRNLNDVQKQVKRLELEKDELQHALDEAEAALEAEETKVLRLQVEVQQVRSDIEKRIQEKEEEFENTRKTHQRAIDSLQASLETEVKSKAELLRVKKTLESDINQLEIALDHANKANVDAQKSLKRLIEQTKEAQQTLDDEQRKREEFRENYLSAEKRYAVAMAEHDEIMQRIEYTEKVRKQHELDAVDLKTQNTNLIASNAALSASKRKLENDVSIARNELGDAQNELKQSEERARKAMADAERLSDEVKQEQEHISHIDRQRKGLELSAKELQAKIDDAEAAMIKFGQRALSKVEERIRAIEQDYLAEQRKHQEAIKGLTRQDKRVREMQFQVEEDKKAFDRLQELVEKLQQKIRVQKRQIEEAEEVAAQNLSKFRQIQLALENAEERADVAENSLARMRHTVVKKTGSGSNFLPAKKE